MVYELAIKQKAINLRRNGSLYSEISDELGVSKSTAYSWTRSIPLTKRGKKLLDSKKQKSQIDKIDNLAVINKRRRIKRDELIEEQAKEIVEGLTVNSSYRKLICSVMFWCEGGKDIAAGIQFINSDPKMVSTFLKLLRQSFDIDESKFRALLHLHEYHDPAKQLQYWSNITNIPTSQFHKPYQKPNTGLNKKENYPGCVSIRYLDRSLGKLLQMIYTTYSDL